MKAVYTVMFGVSVALMVASAAAVWAWGIPLGVDFRGGSVLELSFSARPATAQLSGALAELPIDPLRDASVSPTGDRGFVVRAGALSEAQHREVLAGIAAAFPDAGLAEARFDSVGPAIGDELRTKSLHAVLLTLLVIVAYIAIVFAGMRRVLSWWAMSFATMVALIHDLLIPLGVFAWLGHFRGAEVGAWFLAAVLTVMGYSISDTVVVFDRVRENIVKGRLAAATPFAQAVHVSILQTLWRSLSTSITTLLPLLAIYFFGGATLEYFALALGVGIFAGAYSSIFVASPVLVWLSRRGVRS